MDYLADPKSNDKCLHETEEGTQTQGDPGAETEAMQPPVRMSLEPPVAGRREEGCPLEPPAGVRPC